jgi:GNAT superfamily N-acetyltransferase
MTIREMTERDLEAVLDVIEAHDDDDAEAAEEYFEIFFDEFYEEDEPEIGDRHFVSATDEGEILGVGGAMEDEEEGDRIWWLGWFYVAPKAQRQGVGQALLDRSLEWARDQKGRKIYVDVSALPAYENARSFYAKNGFAEEGRLRDYYAPGEDCILMGKAL